MSDQGATGQGAQGEPQGGEQQQEPFDQDRAMATIKAQRESEAAAKQAAAEARAEADAARKALAEYEAKQKQADDEKLSETERLQKQLDEMRQQSEQQTQATRQRVAKSALRAAAAQAGALYPGDVPALVDLARVDYDDEGEPTNADALVEKLKKDRPALFNERRPGSGDGGPRGSEPSRSQSMDDRIRSASGR